MIEKTIGQVIAERDAGRKLPFMVIFFGGAFLQVCRQTHHATEDEARNHALSVLGRLLERDRHPAIIHGPGLPEHGLKIA